MSYRMRKLTALLGIFTITAASVAGCSNTGSTAKAGSSTQGAGAENGTSGTGTDGGTDGAGTGTDSTAGGTDSTARGTDDTASGTDSTAAGADNENSGTSGSTKMVSATIDTSDMFSSRDKEVGYDESESETITLADGASTTSSHSVAIDGDVITITEAGTYILSGKLADGQIRVETDSSEKVQLVLNGVEITNDDSAAIYVVQADKVFITLASGTQNSLSTTGTFVADGETNVDGVIFSKDDLTLNGGGSLTINSATAHGIVSKDDLVVTSGTYTITAKKHALAGKDSVRIADGTLALTCGEDGIHSENSDDTEKGFVYIAGGSITINSDDDGIHASSNLVIDGGTIDIQKSKEGIEGQVIVVNDGNISVVSSDDGFNASSGGSGTDATDIRNSGGGGNPFDSDDSCSLTVNGGTIQVNADGDGLDSNGVLLITGGETYVSGPTNSGNGALDSGSGATITGGIVVAAGASGMAENFGSSSSTQCSMLVTFDNTENAGTISLKDSSGNELITYQALKTYNSVVISTPEIKVGETYTVTCGSTTNTVEMTDTIYGESNGFGGGGRMGGFGGGGRMERGGRNGNTGNGSPDGSTDSNRTDGSSNQNGSSGNDTADGGTDNITKRKL